VQVIIYSQDNGQVAVCYPTGELPVEELLSRDCPEGAVIVDNDSLPNEHDEFFDAWELNGTIVTVNLVKTKAIAHNKRREARSVEFAPHDEIIMKQISGADSTAAEVARAAIRTKYSIMQTAIDSASTVDAVKSAMPQ